MSSGGPHSKVNISLVFPTSRIFGELLRSRPRRLLRYNAILARDYVCDKRYCVNSVEGSCHLGMLRWGPFKCRHSRTFASKLPTQYAQASRIFVFQASSCIDKSWTWSWVCCFASNKAIATSRRAWRLCTVCFGPSHLLRPNIDHLSSACKSYANAVSVSLNTSGLRAEVSSSYVGILPPSVLFV